MSNFSQVGAAVSPPWTEGVGPIGEVAVDATGYLAQFQPTTRAWAGVHGGVVLGTLLRASVHATGSDPIAISAHLHAPVDLEPAHIAVAARRPGRTITSLGMSLSQAGVPRVSAQVLVGRRATAGPGRQWPRSAPPAGLSQDPASIAPLAVPRHVVPFAEHVDVRPVSEQLPFSGGTLPELRAWIRLAATQPYDAGVAAVLLDALFPSLYVMRSQPVPIPTVEMTAHFAPARDVPDWLFVEQRTTWATAHLCVDDAQLWTGGGVLLAQSRQVRRIVQPSGDRP